MIFHCSENGANVIISCFQAAQQERLQMAETRKQVGVAKEQSARLVNLEEEVVKLGLERDKYRRF